MTGRPSPAPEWMDAPDADPADLGRSLGFIRRINWLLGYNRATANALKRFGLSPGASILDVCAGGGDFAAHAGRGYVGVDFHSGTLGHARRHTPQATFVRGDALRLPFADNAFDAAVCQMALHHFDDVRVHDVLREMTRVTRVGWVAADLLRRRRASAWITLFTAFSGPMVRHDARISVRQAFSPAEARRLAAEHDAAYVPALGHRFLLVRRHESMAT